MKTCIPRLRWDIQKQHRALRYHVLTLLKIEYSSTWWCHSSKFWVNYSKLSTPAQVQQGQLSNWMVHNLTNKHIWYHTQVFEWSGDLSYQDWTKPAACIVVAFTQCILRTLIDGWVCHWQFVSRKVTDKWNPTDQSENVEESGGQERNNLKSMRWWDMNINQSFHIINM